MYSNEDRNLHTCPPDEKFYERICERNLVISCQENLVKIKILPENCCPPDETTRNLSVHTRFCTRIVTKFWAFSWKSF